MKSGNGKRPGPDERSFELPAYRMLGKEQERIRRLPPEGKYLVTGGPGAGKSIVALIRARAVWMLSRENPPDPAPSCQTLEGI